MFYLFASALATGNVLDFGDVSNIQFTLSIYIVFSSSRLCVSSDCLTNIFKTVSPIRKCHFPILFSDSDPIFGRIVINYILNALHQRNGFFGFFLFFSRNVLILKWRFILLDKIFNGRERWSPLTHGVCSPKKKCQNFWNMQTNNEILYTITRFMANQMVHIINPKKHRIFLGSSMFEWSRAFAIN